MLSLPWPPPPQARVEGQGVTLEYVWDGGVLQGMVHLANPALGSLRLPFAARLRGQRLESLPLPSPALGLEGTLEGVNLEVRLRLLLPQATWGERALGRILEAILLRTLERGLGLMALSSPPNPLNRHP